MKLTITNRGTGGKRLWVSDTGLTCLHSHEANIECLSIAHPDRSPTIEEIAEVRNVILNEAKSYAMILGPTKSQNKDFKIITLIEFST